MSIDPSVVSTPAPSPVEVTSGPPVATPAPSPEPERSTPEKKAKASLKDFVDSHPLPVALGIAIGVASTVAGVTQYFHNQDVARLNSEKVAAVASATAPLQKSIDTLTRSNDELTVAMASFRRTAGPNPDVFDIRTLLVERSSARTLSSAFTYYDSYDVYVASPSNHAWKFEETSEAALAGLMQPDALPLLKQMLGDSSPIFKKNLLVWRDTKQIVVTIERNIDKSMATLLGVDQSAQMNLFPFVAIQRADRKFIQQMFKSFAFKEAGDKDVGHTDAATTASADDLDGTQMLLKLSDMFSADIAASMLIGQSNALMGMTQVGKDVTFRITDVEKKGPVLYLSADIVFDNARVRGHTGRKSVTWHRELMVTTVGDAAYLIVTGVPTMSDGRSDAFGWVSQWLQGVRIPCECPQMLKQPPSPRNA